MRRFLFSTYTWWPFSFHYVCIYISEVALVPRRHWLPKRGDPLAGRTYVERVPLLRFSQLFFQRFKKCDVTELDAILLSLLADIPSAVTE